MKHLFGFLFLTILLSACGEDTPVSDDNDENYNLEEVGPDNFTINGIISGSNGQNFYVEAISEQGAIAIAQATADANGSFKIVGNIPGFGIYQLRMGEGQTAKYIPLTLVPDDNVTIEGKAGTFDTQPIVSGTSWSETMTSYMAVFSTFHLAQAELTEQRGTITDEVYTQRFMDLKKPVDNFALNSMKADPGNPFNIVLSASATPTMGFETYDIKNLDILRNVTNTFISKYPDSPMAMNMQQQTVEIERAYNNFLSLSSGGQAPEIALKNPEGSEIKLSSLRGKYVLIDFWASWCQPCRRENPNVVKLYNKYKNDGFTVYSVSLDKDRNAWKQAIAADGLIWPNHVSDLLMWETPLVKNYNFSGIPHTVLIDPDGKIIGQKLRGAELEQKLKEIFKK